MSNYTILLAESTADTPKLKPLSDTFFPLGIKIEDPRTISTIFWTQVLGVLFFSMMAGGAIYTIYFIGKQVYAFCVLYKKPLDTEVNYL